MWAQDHGFEPGFFSIDQNPVCEFCDRSVVTRWGGEADRECDSCRDDFKRMLDANGGFVEIVVDE